MKKYPFVMLPLMLFACCKPEPMIPEEPGWRKFEGVYNVTNLENGTVYNMIISFDSLISITTGNPSFHIIYQNFDASFDTLAGWYPNGTPDYQTRLETFNPEFGVEDYNGSRWSLSMLADDSNTPELENTLVNDTILFYFKKSNIAFYFEDGVPFYECECKHRAVKIE